MSRRSEKSSLIMHEKLALVSGLVSERKIWRVKDVNRYPQSFKYRLVLANPKTHEVILLFDNHWPKGPHIHWSGRERPYNLLGLEKLIQDFNQESEVEEKRYHENKKNSD